MSLVGSSFQTADISVGSLGDRLLLLSLAPWVWFSQSCAFLFDRPSGYVGVAVASCFHCFGLQPVPGGFRRSSLLSLVHLISLIALPFFRSHSASSSCRFFSATVLSVSGSQLATTLLSIAFRLLLYFGLVSDFATSSSVVYLLLSFGLPLLPCFHSSV
jgi:hypothetical protein